MKNKVILGTILLSLLWSVGRIRADDCQLPPFAKQLSPDPNVLFILDNSGSMNQVLEATVDNGYFDSGDAYRYDPDKSYSGGYWSGGIYTVLSDNWYFIGWRGSKRIRAYLVRNDYPGGWQSGRYYGNYLNWIQNYANVTHWFGNNYKVDLPRVNNSWRGIPRYLEDITDASGTPFLDPAKLSQTYKYVQGGSPPTVYNYWKDKAAVRANMAKFAACMSLDPELYGEDAYPINLRFGLMKFNYANGGSVITNCDDPTKLHHLRNIDRGVRRMAPNTWTPLAETLYDAYDYFRLPSGPIEAWCQLNFVVFLTDGESTMDGGFGGAPLWNIGNYDEDNINEISHPRNAHIGEDCDQIQTNFYDSSTARRKFPAGYRHLPAMFIISAIL